MTREEELEAKLARRDKELFVLSEKHYDMAIKYSNAADDVVEHKAKIAELEAELQELKAGVVAEFEGVRNDSNVNPHALYCGDDEYDSSMRLCIFPYYDFVPERGKTYIVTIKEKKQ